MACKFKYGDRVKAGSHDGKIVSIKSDGNGYVCTVKFDNRFLIPREMDYADFDLELIEEAPAPSHVKCTCGTEATYGKIPVENHKYYCDLVTQKGKKAKRDDVDDLLKEFELMLGSDDDDDDDFGFFGV
jgi:hypothetical protein